VIVAFLLTTVLLALSMGLVILTNVESAVAGNFERAAEAQKAADAGVQIAVGRLGAAEWSEIFLVSEPACTTPDGGPIAPTGFYPIDRWGPNSPVWRLYACILPIGVLPSDTTSRTPTVAVWLADDPSEADGDPILDTNGRVTVRAEAFGSAGSHAAIEATVAQADADVRILSWRVLR
jgi:hypothetical protein